MTELEKYELVNRCETVKELENAIIKLSHDNEISGREMSFDANVMAGYVESVVKQDNSPNLLTRKYGIRQQALYLRYYKR